MQFILKWPLFPFRRFIVFSLNFSYGGGGRRGQRDEVWFFLSFLF